MKKAAGFLNQAMERTEVLRAARANSVLRGWKKIIGAEMAKRCQPERYDKGVVWIAVEGSAWAQELRLSKLQILEKLGHASGEEGLFVDLRFLVRTLDGEEQVIELPDTSAYRASLDGLSIEEIRQRRLEKWRQT